MMDTRIKDLWIAALRSKKYKQNIGYLHRKDRGYCCLGVLCELAIEDGLEIKVKPLDLSEWASDPDFGIIIQYDGTTHDIPRSVQKWADLKDPNQHLALMELNDGGNNFSKIASYIKKNL